MIITGRRKERLDDLEKDLRDLGAEVLSLNFDVRKDMKWKTQLQICQRNGEISTSVNNAGLAVGLEHIDIGNIDDWDRMIDTNLKAFSM